MTVENAAREGFPTEGPHIHIWRTVFKAPQPTPQLVEYKHCGVCGCEERVNRGSRD